MKHLLKQLNNFDIMIFIMDFAKTLLIYLIATSIALCLVEASVINDNIFGVYMLAVACTSFMTNGYFWGVLSSIGGVIGVNFFFTFPYLALNFTITGYPVTFTILLLMSILTSFLTSKVKKAAVISAAGKKRAETLNEMSKAILTANDLDMILEIAAEYFFEAIQCNTIIYLGSPTEPQKQVLRTYDEDDEKILYSLLEKEVANQSYLMGKNKGLEIELHSQNCKGTYFPIMTEERTYGVIGLFFDETKPLLDDTYSFISVMIAQTILALQRQEAIENAQKILLETEKEKMRSNLLRAVSHDLRTPLTSILGSSATLIENNIEIHEDNAKKMLQDIHQDTEWLIHMVENLLSVTKISGNDTNLKKQSEIAEEVVAESVSRIKKRFPDAIVEVKVPDELLIVPMDATLIEQVLINLMENAIRHSGSELPITLELSKNQDTAMFKVSDFGKGLDPEWIPVIFDGKITKGTSDSTRGLGIGLTICKSIITAHSGKIYAQNNEHGGASFIFVLPMKGESFYAE